jgi:hypothetical protein
MGACGTISSNPEQDPQVQNFRDWWHGIVETGNMEDERTYQDEQPIISNDIHQIGKLCPSLTKISITAIKRYSVHGSTYFAGRLSDARFLFVDANECKQHSIIIISPRCGPPMDAPWRQESHTGDIGCTYKAADTKNFKMLIPGCIALTLDTYLETLGQLVSALGMCAPRAKK